MIKAGKYMIYRFYNRNTNSYETEFFLPNDSMSRYFNRLCTIASYRDRGYRIIGILYVDKESYLNAKLTNVVEDYMYNDHYEQEVIRKYRRGLMKQDVYLETIKCIQDYKWTCLKRIDQLIRRMVREDFEVENEIALQLYDQYLQEVL